ncbi:universal stress protein [Gammaproteobacteria bacterium]|nr:universal stress protein [Gammaproteobacteria bacterium]
MISTIIAPMDGTEQSDNALRFASEIAQKYDARLILVHSMLRGTSVPVMQDIADGKGFLEQIKDDFAQVETIPIATVAGVAAPMEVLSDETLEKFGRLLLKSAADTLTGIDDIQSRVVDSDPAKAILLCAEEEQADLIVIGSHGVGDLKSLLLGSVSHKVIEPCVVVK